MAAGNDPADSLASNVPVLIIGAGPTGLTLALWLTRFGIRVRIIDKTAQPGTTSRALAVQARTLEFYRQFGFADDVVDGGVKVAGANLWVRGQKRARLSLENLGEGFTPFAFALVFPQDAHEKLLIKQLNELGVHVERQTELVQFEQSPEGVRATVKRPDGTQEICEARYLAGCDGARSIVRETLGIQFPGGTYTGLFYVADVEASGPAIDRELHVDLDESDLLIVFPLKESGCLRLVGSIRELPQQGEQELTFNDVGSRAIEHLKLTINKVNWFSTYRVHHRVANHFRGGRVFLLGDAGHVHSPVGGQGMNTGIGDAINLAWKLAAVLSGGAETLLETYETERIGFARQLVATTDRVFTVATASGGLTRFVRTRIVPVVLPVLFRIPFVRAFLFRTVSQTGIQYRQSPLSTGQAGSIAAGDRLPWVKTAPNEDNFAPLKSLDWQVHVYGQTGREMTDVCETLHLPLHAFEWTSRMSEIGIARDAVYLIRPDGYVALADRHGDPNRLHNYFKERNLPTRVRE